MPKKQTLTFAEELKFEEWRNLPLENFLNKQDTQLEKDAVARTYVFLKKQYPEIEELLNGRLAYRMTWKVNPKTRENYDVHEEEFEWESPQPDSQQQ